VVMGVHLPSALNLAAMGRAWPIEGSAGMGHPGHEMIRRTNLSVAREQSRLGDYRENSPV